MHTITRRSFLQTATLAAGSLTMLPAASYAQVANANDDIRLAIVGINSKGADHINIFQKLPGCRIVALCDADERVLRREQARLEKNSIKTQGFIDLRKLLEQNDIDAVVTATPNHWHSLVAVWSCQAGKDVYVEKPVSHEIWEGRKVVEAARRHHCMVQAGTQSRSDPALYEAFDYLRQGNLGEIKIIRGFCYKRRGTIGKVLGPQPLPAGINYDLWTGPAPLVPLMRKNLHYDWHWVWPTGNGDIGNQGIHEMDMCRWVAGQDQLPPRVMSIGGRFGYEDDGETPNTQISIYDYKPVPIIFEVRGLPRAKDEEGEAMDNYKGARVGLVVECENGYFSGGAGGGSVFDYNGKRIKQFVGTGGRDHQLNFLKAVRSRKLSDLNADIEKGHLSSALCHLGNISYRLGQKSAPEEIRQCVQSNKYLAETFARFETHLKVNDVDINKQHPTLGPWLTMDPTKERFTGEMSNYANMYLKRQYREPYVIRDSV